MTAHVTAARKPKRARKVAISLKYVRPLVEDDPNGRRLRLLPEGALRLPEAYLNTSTLITGITGSGKSTQVIQPLLQALIASREVSVVNFDVTEALGPWLRAEHHAQQGGDAGFIHVNPTRTDCWRFNPVPQTDRFDRLSNFVSALSRAPVASGDGMFFLLQARQLTIEIIRCLRRVSPAKEVTLRQVIGTLDNASSLEALGTTGNSAPLRQFGLDITTNNNARTSLMEAQNIFRMARDEAVAEATSGSDFRFEQLEEAPTILNVAVPESRAQDLGCFFQMFLDRFVDWVTATCEARQGPLRRPIVIVIDELAVLRDLDIGFINTLRKRRVGLIGALQSVTQLDLHHAPAKARTLEAGFINRILVPPLGDTDVLLAEERLGTIRVPRLMTGRQGAVEAVHAEARPLLSRGDLNGPPHPRLGPLLTLDFKSLRVPPFQAYVRPIYRRPGWRRVERLRAELPWPPAPPASAKPPGRSRRVGRLTKSLPANQRRLWVRLNGELDRADTQRATALAQAAGALDEAQILELADFIAHRHLGLAEAGERITQFYAAWRRERESRPLQVLELIAELARDELTIQDFFLGYVYSQCDDTAGILQYCRYRRQKSAENAAKRAAFKAAQPELDESSITPENGV